MPIQNREAAREAAGLTEEQLNAVVGGLTVTENRARALGASREQIDSAQEGVRSIITDSTIIAAKYNRRARQAAGTDAREGVSAAEVNEDRAVLEEIIHENFTFIDFQGVVGNRESTIENILSGKIQKDGFGARGFATVEETFQVLGDTAVYVGAFEMRGSVLAKNVRSGQVRPRSLSGLYRTTHTYVYQDGRWQLLASHMTLEPRQKTFVHGPDEAADAGVSPEGLVGR